MQTETIATLTEQLAAADVQRITAIATRDAAEELWLAEQTRPGRTMASIGAARRAHVAAAAVARDAIHAYGDTRRALEAAQG